MPFMFKQRAPQYSIPFLQSRKKFTRSELQQVGQTMTVARVTNKNDDVQRATFFCRKCNNQNPSNVNFCPECGALLVSGDQPDILSYDSSPIQIGVGVNKPFIQGRMTWTSNPQLGEVQYTFDTDSDD